MESRRNRARISLAVLTIFAIVTVFAVRLVDIQLVQASELNKISNDKLAQSLIKYGTRGPIIDSNGNILASSVERYDITVSPRVVLGDHGLTDKVINAMNRIALITEQDPATLISAITDDPTSDFAYLTKSVTLDVFHKVRDLEVPGVFFQLRPSRTYPNGAIAGNLVGFIGTDGPQAGLELTENECLKSTDGSTSYEKGEDGVPLPGSLVTTKEPKNGGTLQLTIDRDLQWYVQKRIAQTYKALGAEWATAVVIRVKDGHLMAVADYPSVDPNNVDGVPNTALGSRAFSWAYEPGSTMKAITAATLLDTGAATQTSHVVAPGRLYLSDGGFIKDSFSHDDLRLTLTGALVYSSNTGVSLLSKKVPASVRRDTMLRFGLNKETEVGFNGESEGDVHPVDQWDERTNLAVQFGQGMTATSVQMASAYQTLGNGGVRMPVTLVEGCTWPDGTVTDRPKTTGTRAVSESAAKKTVQIMEQVVNHGWASANLTIPGYRIAAKSGTAEVAENGIYGKKTVISFAGVAPADNPEYAIVVTAGIPNKLYSSGAIASTFRDITSRVLTTFRVTPSTTRAPELPLTW
ncbi:MAG: penicillin-binding protein 2 [Salinibacterium sp.]|nr:MAG: penicillin-binding protein 2 [Salinibacterium sp.]